MRLPGEFVSPAPEQIENDTHGESLLTEERETVYTTIWLHKDILARPKLCKYNRRSRHDIVVLDRHFPVKCNGRKIRLLSPREV